MLRTLQSETKTLPIGLFFLRVVVSVFMLVHGLPKLMNFQTLSTQFPDPIGVGSTASLALAVFAEVGCSILLLLGVKPRLSAIPLLITMLVAAFVIHADDPWQKKELALLFATIYGSLFLTGGGAFCARK